MEGVWSFWLILLFLLLTLLLLPVAYIELSKMFFDPFESVISLLDFFEEFCKDLLGKAVYFWGFDRFDNTGVFVESKGTLKKFEIEALGVWIILMEVWGKKWDSFEAEDFLCLFGDGFGTLVLINLLCFNLNNIIIALFPNILLVVFNFMSCCFLNINDFKIFVCFYYEK